MSGPAIDHRKSEFLLLAKAHDFRGAHKSLEALASETSMEPTSLAIWQSHLLQMEGNIDEAANVLKPHIDSGDMPGGFLRHQRARLFLSSDRLEEARADLEALLADDHPRIATLHSGCRVQLAYVLAQQGSPKFRKVFDAIPDGRDYFIKDSIIGKDDLAAMFQARRGTGSDR